MTDDDLSGHPVDRLIRELIQTPRTATLTEIEQITERMATAPFNADIVPVPPRYRGLAYQGRTVGVREASLFLHLVEHVIVDSQWPDGTTEVHYAQDLRRAIRWPAARLAVYQRRGGSIAAIVTETADIIPGERLGAGHLPGLIVIFSADRGILISGYQFSARATISIPEDAQWLR